MPSQRVADLIHTGNCFIDPDIRYRDPWPFGCDQVRDFFRRFEDSRFNFPERVGSLYILDGRHDWPNASWAFGYLFRQKMNELRNAEERPEAVAVVLFEVGGHTHEPSIALTALRQKLVSHR